uniref:N-acetylglucosaminyl transferase component domain containing protein, putative n=1 Tax=Neospora caninum (strain Liverpool) TaxID=572307 RepID=A0A0F7UBU9_NEOCL|nr:TPA: N-acetylglucosaminyl transferase component domain containing protein, putative [Neospora caninum Liverpool]
MNVSSYPFRLFVPVEFLSSSPGWITGWVLGESTAIVAALLPPLPFHIAARLFADAQKRISSAPSLARREVVDAREADNAESEARDEAGDERGDTDAAGSEDQDGRGERPVKSERPCGPAGAPQRAKFSNSWIHRNWRDGQERPDSKGVRVSPPLRILGWWRGRDDAAVPGGAGPPGRPVSLDSFSPAGPSCRLLGRSSLSEKHRDLSTDAFLQDVSQPSPSGAPSEASPRAVGFAGEKNAFWIEVSIHSQTGLPVPFFARQDALPEAVSGSACGLLAPLPTESDPVAAAAPAQAPRPSTGLRRLRGFSRAAKASPAGPEKLPADPPFSRGEVPYGMCPLDRQGDWALKPVQIFLLRLPTHHGFTGEGVSAEERMNLASADSASGCFVKTQELIEALQRPLLWRETADFPREKGEAQRADSPEARGLSAGATETGDGATGSLRRNGRAGGDGLRQAKGRETDKGAKGAELSRPLRNGHKADAQRRRQRARSHAPHNGPVKEEKAEATAQKGNGDDAQQRTEETLEVVWLHLQGTAKVVASVSKTLTSWQHAERSRRSRFERQQRSKGQNGEDPEDTKSEAADEGSPSAYLFSLASSFFPQNLTPGCPTRGLRALQKRFSSLALFLVYFLFRFFELLWYHGVLVVYPGADRRLARARSQSPCDLEKLNGSGSGSTPNKRNEPQPFFWGTADHLLSSLSSLAACAPLLRRYMHSRERDMHAVSSHSREQRMDPGAKRSGGVVDHWKKPKTGVELSPRASGREHWDAASLPVSPEPSRCSCGEEICSGVDEKGAGGAEGPQGSLHGRKRSRAKDKRRDVSANESDTLDQSRGRERPSVCPRCEFFSLVSASEADRLLAAPSLACPIPKRLPWYLSVAPLRILGVVTAIGLDLLIGLFIPHLLAILVTGLVLPSSCRSCLPFSAFSPLAQSPPESGREICSAVDSSALLLEFDRGKADLYCPQLDPWESCLQPAWQSSCTYSFLRPLGPTATMLTDGGGTEVASDALRADLSSIPLCFSSAASCLLYGPPPSLFALFSRAYCFLHLRLLADHVRWLMDNPAGFKLNPNLGSILGSLILTTLHYWNEAASVLYDFFADLWGSNSGTLALPLALLLSLFSFLSGWLLPDNSRSLALLQKENGRRRPANLDVGDEDGCPGSLFRPLINLVSCSTFHIGVEFVTLAFGAVLSWRGPTRGWAWGGAFFFATAADLMLFSTAHVFYIYMVCAKLMETSCQCLCTLFTMFRGKKRNILRHRVDTLEFELDQLLMGCILFTIMSCLFPTVFVFYFSFAIIWLSILFVHSMLRLVALLVRRLPLSLLLLRLIYPGLFPGSISVRVLEDGCCTQAPRKQVADDETMGTRKSRNAKGGSSERSSTQVQNGQEGSSGKAATLAVDCSVELSQPHLEDSSGSELVPSVELPRHSVGSLQGKLNHSTDSHTPNGNLPCWSRPGPAPRCACQNRITYIELQTHPVSWGEILLPTFKEALSQTFWPFSPGTLFPSIFSGRLIHFKRSTNKAE